MAKMTLKGFDEYEMKLSRMKLAYQDEIIGACVYVGAEKVANACKASIRALPIVTGWGTPDHPLPGGVTAAQKVGLLEGFGITDARNDNGYVNVKLGFNKYNSTFTEKYPGGQPNQLVARGCESGTSWKRKHPFIRPAVNASRGAAIAAMKDECDKRTAKYMK